MWICLVAGALLATPVSTPAQSIDAGWLARYDLEPGSGERVRLPRALRELSGLATDAQGRLFGHEDETSAVYEIDPADGKVLRRFHVGRRGMKGDFEGIAVAGPRMFMTTSDGVVLEFRAAPNGEVATSHRHRTGLGERCEIEGLAYEESTGFLLLPCKTPRARALRDHVTVFAVDPNLWTVDPRPRVSFPTSALREIGLDDEFRPSAIEVHPVSGSLFMLAGIEATLLEIGPDGTLLAGASLDEEDHPQAESLAFDLDLSLLVGDERGRGGTLRRYPLATHQ